MIKLTFLTRSLDYGGAERQMVTLAKELDKKYFDVSVICFYGGGPLQKELESNGIHVLPMDKQGRWDVFPFLRKLVKSMQIIQPDIIHGYLELSNILAICLKPFLPATRMVFGVRASFMDSSRYDFLYDWVLRLESSLSRFSDCIIVNSIAGKLYCERRGFVNNNLLVVPNGIDTIHFRRDLEARERVRSQWGITKDACLVGLIGRVDPMKDHPTFLKAASIVAKDHPNVRFVCVGDGTGSYWAQMKNLGETLGLSESLIWAGAREDMPSVYNALDICCSSSYGEGFSNIIGEAMSCEVPCVVTNVGDSALVVGDTGIVVPAKNAGCLASALRQMIMLSIQERQLLGEKARKRIESEFNLSKMIITTQNILVNLVS